jgi:hypothetical protein
MVFQAKYMGERFYRIVYFFLYLIRDKGSILGFVPTWGAIAAC